MIKRLSYEIFNHSEKLPLYQIKNYWIYVNDVERDSEYMLEEGQNLIFEYKNESYLSLDRENIQIDSNSDSSGDETKFKFDNMGGKCKIKRKVSLFIKKNSNIYREEEGARFDGENPSK